MVFYLATLGAWGAGPVRFADVQFRLLTSGAHQLSQDLGAFQSSLPLGVSGELHRAITITNETRGSSRKIALSITMTPLLGDDGTLHCMVLTDATPEGEATVSRAKDLTFSHPGEQIMELIADPATGAHLLMAIQVTLPPEERAAESPRWPRLLFTVKVERWDGPDRLILDTIQLTSEDGLPVDHRYSQKIPRWVEDEEAKKTGQTDMFKSLPVIDPADTKTVLKAGEGFSILLPNAKKGQPPDKSPAPPEANPFPGEAGASPSPAGGNPTGGQECAPSAAARPPDAEAAAGASASHKSLIWVEEWLKVSILPREIREGTLSFQLDASGEILDLKANAPVSLGQKETSRKARPAEPVPLYLTREESGGPRGYVIWVVPEW